MNRTLAVLLVSGFCTLTLCSAAPPPLKAYGVAAIEKITQTHEPTAEWRAGRVAIECARNESESFQVVARSSRPIENLSVALEDLRAAGGAVLPAACISVRKVEWVDVNAPFDPAEASKHPNFLPDPLPPVDAAKDRFRVGQGENLVFWLTVTVPEAARAGIYRGRVRLLGWQWDGCDRCGGVARARLCAAKSADPSEHGRAGIGEYLQSLRLQDPRRQGEGHPRLL